MSRIRLDMLFSVAILAFFGGVATAQLPPTDPDPLAIVGTGRVGTWTTELTLSNPLEEAMTVEVKSDPGHVVCVLPCDFVHTIPARGTIVIPSPAPDAVGVTYVSKPFGSVPSVLARVLDGTGRSVDLPVFRLSTLRALDPSELVFAGAQRWTGGTVNLLLANIWIPLPLSGGPVTLRLEAFDANGASLGSREVTLELGENRFLADALGFLGVGVVEVGQLSVRRVGGTGSFWGTLFVVRADGSLSASLGATP